MTIGEFSVLRIARNGLFAAALAIALAGVGATKAQAGGKWVAGAILGGLVAGAIIHHAHAQHYKSGYHYRPVRKVRVVRRHRHRHHYPLHIHVGHFYYHHHHHHYHR